MQWKAETRAVIFEHRKMKFFKGYYELSRISDHCHCYKDLVNRNIISLRAII